MMKHIIYIIVACLAVTTAQAQVITQLAKEAMQIPRGDRPDDDKGINQLEKYTVNVDTTSAYNALLDSVQQATDAQQWSRAEQFIKQMVALDPTNVNNSLLLSNLGTVQRMQGKFDDALRSYNMALDMTPNAVAILTNRGVLHIQRGELDAADADLQRVVERDAQNEEALFWLAFIAMNRGQADVATSRLYEILAFNPRSVQALEGKALLAKATGDYTNALSLYTQLIENAQDADYYANRADCALMLRNLSQASEDIQSALNINPDDGYLYLLRAKLNKMRFNFDDMDRDIKLAEQHGVDPEEIQNSLK
jgi:tetratricopeptide (TPR) repeat protein